MTIPSEIKDDDAAIRDKAQEYLARREYSVYELTQKLVTRGFDEMSVLRVVSGLADDKFVDDERFAESLCRSRIGRGYGPVWITQELRKRGVDDNIVARVVDINDASWLMRLDGVRERKYGRSPPEDHKSWARQARFLASRGFTSEQIRRVLDGRFDADTIL